jgi:hypothetical protein
MLCMGKATECDFNMTWWKVSTFIPPLTVNLVYCATHVSPGMSGVQKWALCVARENWYFVILVVCFTVAATMLALSFAA